MKYQFGSFEVQSPLMLSTLEALHINADKKYFIVVGENGSGKTTMLHYINRTVFNGSAALFDEVSGYHAGMEQAVITTTKEDAYDVIKQFDRRQVHIVEMPNLADRKADIVPFCNFFTEVLGLMNNQPGIRLTEKSLEKIIQYNWPGNFHELESILERAFLNSQSGDTKTVIEPEHVELNLQTKELEFSIGQKLDEIERKYILQTLYFVHQNRTKAAEILGISIRTLRNKINQYREEGYL